LLTFSVQSTASLELFRRLLAENAEKIPADIRGEVDTALGELKEALKAEPADGDNTAALRQATDKVTAAAQKVGTAMYAQAQGAQGPTAGGTGAASGGAEGPGGAGPGAGGTGAGGPGAGGEDEEVVDAEIVDDEDKRQEGSG
jgi:molecular chaperone DnaK